MNRTARFRIKRNQSALSPDGRVLAAFGISSDSKRWNHSSSSVPEPPLTEDDCAIEIWDVPPARSWASCLAWAAVVALFILLIRGWFRSRRLNQEG